MRPVTAPVPEALNNSLPWQGGSFLHPIARVRIPTVPGHPGTYISSVSICNS
ncbi:hypothetical protein ASZ90_009133 [hydrocarbon metagenome]|uniref:Uncharacterized protein n=1 Tax=hydrocarbon metagenome TaxID=938273 RepID=A0A0W8FJM9_9ZZZZ